MRERLGGGKARKREENQKAYLVVELGQDGALEPQPTILLADFFD